MCALQEVMMYHANATVTVRTTAFCRMLGTESTEKSIVRMSIAGLFTVRM